MDRDRRLAWAAALLTVIGSIRIASTWRVLSHTIDENAHLAAGMQWLSEHKYDYEAQHPPLARVVGALVPYLRGERSHHVLNIHYEGFKILGWNAHYDRVLALGRSGILVFYWIASAVVFWWARRIGGSMAGLLAIAIFSTTPPILAHSGLITTDMALAAFTSAAIVASLEWAREPDWRRTILVGVLTACAVASKFSALVFLPAAWLAMYGWRVFCDRPDAGVLSSEVRRRIRPACGAVAIAALVIWAIYRFTFGPVGVLGGMRLPAPQFYQGIYDVWMHNREGHGSFLLGKLSLTGFWYYYPVVLSVKTPLAMLGLVAVVSAIALWRRRRDLGMPMAMAAGIVLFALTSRINIGVRHILPVYTAFAVIAGVGLSDAFLSRRRWMAVAGALLLAWQMAESIRIHPDYVAYTNQLAGTRPERILADSDLDWGQDMNRLHDFFADKGAKEVAIKVLNFSYSVELGHDLPKRRAMPADGPAPGWNVWSASSPPRYGWMDRIPPTLRIGRGTFLWYSEPPRPVEPPPDPHRLQIATPREARVIDDTTGLRFTGPWVSVKDFGQAYRGTLTYSDRRGASINLAFEGDAITYLFTRAFNRGIAAVEIDGVKQPPVDLYAAQVQWQQSQRFVLARAGRHTIRILVTGRRRPESQGDFIDIDAFLIEGTKAK
jgi:hypothetical protein